MGAARIGASAPKSGSAGARSRARPASRARCGRRGPRGTRRRGRRRRGRDARRRSAAARRGGAAAEAVDVVMAVALDVREAEQRRQRADPAARRGRPASSGLRRTRTQRAPAPPSPRGSAGVDERLVESLAALARHAGVAAARARAETRRSCRRPRRSAAARGARAPRRRRHASLARRAAARGRATLARAGAAPASACSRATKSASAATSANCSLPSSVTAIRRQAIEHAAIARAARGRRRHRRRA